MPTTIKYIGTQRNYFELAVTGKQSNWEPGQTEERADAEAALLLATGLFSAATVPVTAQTNPLTGGTETFAGGVSLGKSKSSQETTFGRRVFASNAASDWSNASSTAPGAISETTDYSFGDDGPALKMTFAPATTSITRATRNFDGFATAGTNLNGRTITIPVYITDPGRIRQFLLYLSSQASGFSTFAVASLDQGNLEVLVPGINYLSFHCTDTSVSTAWTLTTETFANPIKQMRISVSTYGIGCGPIYFGAPKVSARTRPTMLISMDDGWASQLSHSALGFDGACEYLRRSGLRATLYVPSTLVGTANYLTLAQLQELYADGFDISNHTKSHTEFNSYQTLGSAAPGANTLTISTASAPGTENASRVFIDSTTSVSDNIHIARVSGIRASDGVAVTELMTIGLVHGSMASDTVFSSVTAIDLKAIDGTTAYAAVGTISAWWTAPYSVALTAIKDGRDFLVANGMLRSADHFCYPRGQYNPEVLSILSSLGTKTARTICIGSISPRRGIVPNKLLMPAGVLGGSANTAAKMLAETQAAIDQGATREVFFHNFVAGTPAAGTETKFSDFTAFVDDLATKQKAGLIDVMTKSEFYNRYTFI